LGHDVRAFADYPGRISKSLRAHPTSLALYAVVGLHAFIFQAFIRLQQCSGAGECVLSLMKGLIWSLLWPVYWLGYYWLFETVRGWS
jgi:hypothetical protein